MVNVLLNMFLEHPTNVKMTYTEHMFYSFKFSKIMCLGCIKSFIHGVFPFLYETSSTDIITNLNTHINKKKI